MPKPLKVTLFIGNEVLHTCQLLVGLEILQIKGLINLEYKSSPQGKTIKPFCACIINDKKIVFEFHDRPEYIDLKQYDWCDWYIKRSITKDTIQKNIKLLPWGLNYYIAPSAQMGWQLAKNKPSISEAAKAYIRSNILLSKLFNIKNGIATCNWKNFQQSPLLSNNPKIIFSPRLWNPVNSISGELIHERFGINEERIEIVKALRKHFFNFYDGGIEDTTEARKLCPDLILPFSGTHKNNYIKRLKTSSIGIATKGIASSVGWKFAEYILFSKAIVSNNLANYLFNSPIEAGINYLSFFNMEEFLNNVEILMSNKSKRTEMMTQNYIYAQENLMPDGQLLRAFEIAGIYIEKN